MVENWLYANLNALRGKHEFILGFDSNFTNCNLKQTIEFQQTLEFHPSGNLLFQTNRGVLRKYSLVNVIIRIPIHYTSSARDMAPRAHGGVRKYPGRSRLPVATWMQGKHIRRCEHDVIGYTIVIT